MQSGFEMLWRSLKPWVQDEKLHLEAHMNGVREDNPLEALLDTQVRQKDRRVCAQMQETLLK